MTRTGCALVWLLACPTVLAAPAAGAGPPRCFGDCDGDRIVTIDELTKGIDISTGGKSVDECPAAACIHGLSAGAKWTPP